MSNGHDIDGKIVLARKKHEVEYEPSGMTGLSTLYLRVKGGDKNVPIFVDDIDGVIEMLRSGQAAIAALEA